MQSTHWLPRVPGSGSRGLVLAAAVQLGACATITQEDPPSLFDGSAGMPSSLLPTDVSGAGGTAPIAEMPAPVRPPNQMSPTGNSGTTLPPVSSGGAGGAAGAASGASGAGAGGAGAPQTPQFPMGMVLLEENFENFTGAGWTASQGSVWMVQTDAQVVSNVYTQSDVSSNDPRLAAGGDATWRDVIVEADMKILAFMGSSSSYMAGLCVRVADAENFHFVGIRSNDGKVGLRRFTDGSGSNQLQSDYEDGTTGVWYHLRVDAIGSTITASLDGEQMFTTTDTTHANGGIGLCTARGSASFDNIRVTAP